MPTLLNLDSNRNEIVYVRNNIQIQSPSSSALYPASEDSRISSSSSEYSYGDSSNAFNMDSLNLVVNSPVSAMETDGEKPYLLITEQPIDKFRFRYKSEMHGTHGCLTGIATNKIKRTFPTVQLMNFTGDAIIRCSLYQVDTLNKLHHSHSLVVRKDNDDIKDPHDVEVSPAKGYTAIFVGMGIIHTAKKFIVDELHEKLVSRMSFRMARDITERENQQLRIQAENEAKNMNLNKVCLCFEAFQFIDDNWVSICEPVLSNAINNMKSALTGELKITRLSTNISEANGGDDVFLFVEKVGKKNVKVRFYENNEDDELVWEDWGKFNETDVHHQYAIALRTPPYRDKDIEDSVECCIQLVRPSDNCYSEPKPFRYKPSRAVSSRKRARVNTPYSSAELPTILPVVETISKEFNKSAMIADVINQRTNHQDFEKFLSYLSENFNVDELPDALIDPAELLDPKEISKELRGLTGESMLKTDCVITDRTVAKESSTQFGPELLIPLMHKIMLRHSAGEAAEKIRSLFSCEYENNRFIFDFLITYNPAIFKHFLTFVEKLRIVDVLGYQNDHKKSCLHLVCENCSAEIIYDIVPILIRLGADPNLTDDKGDTVLHVLIQQENLSKCVDLFVNATYPNGLSLNLEIENDDSLTPLLLAARLNRVEIVQSLLAAGASIERVHSKDGNNILHIAVKENSEDLVALILEGTTIDVTRKNSANKMPIELANANSPQNLKILHLLNNKHDQHLNTSTIDDSDDVTSSFASESNIDCEGFDRLLSFNTNKYPKEIKTEPSDDYEDSLVMDSDNQQTFSNSNDDIFDDTCLDQLCQWFNRSDRWRKLARCMDLEAYVNVWASSKNPSKMLFKFSEVQGTSLKQIIDIFKQLNESNALVYIDEMIARQLENDY